MICVDIKCDSYKRNSTQATDILIRRLKNHKMQQLRGKECGGFSRNAIYYAEQTKQFVSCCFCNDHFSNNSNSQNEWSNLWPSCVFAGMKRSNPK